ncbi:hypothetical protein RRG08_015636 [Elysia crispata]|uniref:Uncharacterized protein n=1 Tax=Elysia crispata TaxID=231223 RepID=A0AAE0Y779_9GAST|nr:hypothetical protein RRG08_015636 [Elysia crispata]
MQGREEELLPLKDTRNMWNKEVSEDRGAFIFILQKEMKTRNIWSVIIVSACCDLTLTEVVIEAWDGTGGVADLFVSISIADKSELENPL